MMDAMEMTPVVSKFVLHWGEMGTRWGVNRTVAQVHALLFIAPEPMHAEAICNTLGVARSNVSNALKDLQGWGIVRTVHVLGDRRDHFESMKDVWEMFQIILDERKKREIDPTLAVLRECVAEAEKKPRAQAHTREQLQELLGLVETMSDWYTQVRRLPRGAMIKFVKMGGKVRKLMGVG